MTMRTVRGIFGLGAVLVFSVASGVVGCSSTARFPICQEDADCAEQATAKLCYDHRCVQCRGDSECPDGFCERKVGECRSLGNPGAQPEPATTASASAEPDASAAPAK
jgi:hypothetical protein